MFNLLPWLHKSIHVVSSGAGSRGSIGATGIRGDLGAPVSCHT